MVMVPCATDETNPLVKSVCETVLKSLAPGPHLCTRILVCVMIGLLELEKCHHQLPIMLKGTEIQNVVCL